MALHIMHSTSVPPGFASTMSYAQVMPHMHHGFAGLSGYAAPPQPAISDFDKWRFTQEADRAEHAELRQTELEREQRAADREVERERQQREFERQQRDADLERERVRERKREREADREFEREQRVREQETQIKLAEIQAAANANSVSLHAANASNAQDSDPSLNTRPFRVDLAAKLLPTFNQDDLESYLASSERIADLNSWPDD
jgi:hypothetical protein